jgi:hypothetical protein
MRSPIPRPNMSKEQRNAAWARKSLSDLQRKWFAEENPYLATLDPRPDHAMTVLLLRTYEAFRSGKPLHKSAAWSHTSMGDIKTGRKYIAQAERLGLIKIERSNEDRRKELIQPTPILIKAVERELLIFAAHVLGSAAWLNVVGLTPMDLTRAILEDERDRTREARAKVDLSTGEVLEVIQTPAKRSRKKVRQRA